MIFGFFFNQKSDVIKIVCANKKVYCILKLWNIEDGSIMKNELKRKGQTVFHQYPVRKEIGH